MSSGVTISYNKAGLLESVKARIKGGTEKDYVKNIDYDAKGQRMRIQYGNDVTTRYTYDKKTFRLTRLRSSKNGGTETLQDITYTYDPVGNITQIYDIAQDVVFRNNSIIRPKQEYTYDGLYRLKEATGRESKAIGSNATTHKDILQTQNIPANSNEIRNYTQYYAYDSVGNIETVQHVADLGSWTRTYSYEDDNNRLKGDTIGGATNIYTYNQHGSMTKRGHLRGLHWDYKDQLIHTKISGQQDLYCTYDTSRQRVRKIYKTANNIKERIYLGDYEIYRLRSANGATINQQIDTLHIMDDQQRICLIETEDGNTPLTRYQLNNHLGSACMELSETAEVISYEEYHPYGSSSYRAQKNRLDGNPKRYRYSGKEQDESTGLHYYGARYYSSWLGRWCSADPAGLVDGGNLYGFVLGNPVRFIDENAKELTDFQKKIMRIVERDKRPQAKKAERLKTKLAENYYESEEQAQQAATQAGNELYALKEVGFWESLNPFVAVPNKYREVSARTRLAKAKHDLTPVEHRTGSFSYAPVIGAISEIVADSGVGVAGKGGALIFRGIGRGGSMVLKKARSLVKKISIPPVPASSRAKLKAAIDRLPKPSKPEEYIDLTDSKAKTHIIEGEFSMPRERLRIGGGHKHGLNLPGKSEFPFDWSDKKIYHEASDIATNPRSRITEERFFKDYDTGEAISLRTKYEAERDGLNIVVIVDEFMDPNAPTRIVTTFPNNVRKNH